MCKRRDSRARRKTESIHRQAGTRPPHRGQGPAPIAFVKLGSCRFATACLLLASALASGGATASDLRVEIHEPTPKTLLPALQTSVEVVGGASIYGGVKALDLFLVMDSSESLRRTDPDDHRTKGVVALVRSLHPRSNIHLGVVDFDRKAVLEAELTPDRDAVVHALNGLDQRGETNIAEGIRTALAGFVDRGRPGASRVILLFTDGKSEEKAALAAMAEAHAAGASPRELPPAFSPSRTPPCCATRS